MSAATCEYCPEDDPYRLSSLTVTKDHGETFQTIKVCPDHVGLYLHTGSQDR